jgi:DNA-binding transcriptional regulator YdaS (Cro superfamily)
MVPRRDTIEARAVRRAVEIAGGVEPLATLLKVAPGRITLWASAMEPVPPRLFPKVVDLLLEQDLAQIRADIARRNAGYRGGRAR